MSLWFLVRFEHGHMTTWSQVLILYDEWWDLNMIIWPHSHMVMLYINWIISLLNYYVHLDTFSCIHTFRGLIYNQNWSQIILTQLHHQLLHTTKSPCVTLIYGEIFHWGLLTFSKTNQHLPCPNCTKTACFFALELFTMH